VFVKISDRNISRHISTFDANNSWILKVINQTFTWKQTYRPLVLIEECVFKNKLAWKGLVSFKNNRLHQEIIQRQNQEEVRTFKRLIHETYVSNILN
jgi:hypothetical protein